MSISNYTFETNVKKIARILEAAATKKAEATDKLAEEQRRANEIALMALILEHGPESVRDALKVATITDHGIRVKVPKKKAAALDLGPAVSKPNT